MSKKQWIVLLMLFLAYLFLGASIFYHIESRLEIEQIERAKEKRIEINALLLKHYIPSPSHNQHEIFERLTQYCGKSVYNYTDGESDPLKWDFYNSFYFAYTVVSTIGYGNLAPTNMLSRILMMIYGLLGIPMNGILLSQLGEFFGHVFVRAHRKYKSYKKHQNDYAKKLTPLETRKAGLAAQIFMYLIPGFVMFIFFPAFLFSHYEGWTYDEAVYYAFVTLTTIGFGDYVAGQDNTKGNGFFFVMYKTFLICWISFGLGYIVMIMTFIAQGMRSKKIIRIEHKLAMNLKHTQSKIWNEFNKEINYFRRVFNELQFSKVKRVYVDEYNYEIPPTKFLRSNSFPDLRKLIYGGFESSVPLHPRRRANSEVVPMDPLVRVVSETDLQRIDKTATFAAHAMVQPAELLARLVNVLGYIPPPDDANDTSDWDQEYKNKEDTKKTGIEGIKEKDIFNKQNTWNESSWRIGADRFPGMMPRSRAASEVRLDMGKNDSNIHQQNGEWTWSGPAASRKIQELIKTRRTGLSGIKDSKSYKFPSITLPKSVPKNLFSPWRRQSSNKKALDAEQSIQKGTLPDIDLEAGENYSSITAHSDLFSSNLDDVNETTTTSRHPYYTHTGANFPSLMESNNILEETSLADFLRALTVLHAKISTVPSDYSNTRKPQRKMGTASLTPPKLPSLFTLFSQSADSQGHSQSNQNTVTTSSSNRRYSLRPSEYSPASTPSYARRGSAINPIKPRRFSLRPVATPTSTPPEYTASYLNSRTHDDQKSQFSSLADTFVYESAKKPLVQMEGTPGVSSPIATFSNVRRLSLRPMTQIQQPPSQQIQATKALPRWKAGMLQRQIGRMSVHRRVRAFSLSDVQADKSEKSTGLSPLAIDDNGKPVTSIVSSSKPNVSAVQKTVTIVSPTKNEVLRSDSNESTSVDTRSLVNTSSNPFVSSFVTSETPGNSDTTDNLRFKDVQGDEASSNIALSTLQKASEHEINYNDTSKQATNSENNERNVENMEVAKEITEKLIFHNDPASSKEIFNDKLTSSKDVSSDIKDSSKNSSKSTIDSTIKSSNEKPRIFIDFYKTSLDVKIEKPSVNPFLQYQATTSASQYGNTNLTEIKGEKRNEARKAWKKE
uniref:open rectifier potassium channel protein 1 isoform X1 n=2 Tax=Vespula vulgaris TaxID=7454 RepID=UPI00213D518D|nr:open rectifier potassium channel protein 1 isoform X1 [Vespula vulgaris]XP_050848065.1 open rectifier potassium channel protein 1 isoform X1 [Vespula vulgaris]XP_050848066.1 open rectifier potassium channel protein 1 isoform X1 [Vespula vulgaris]XP_050848067.1 open rectifier potassium channel protein 1 isoform X1 [Vespula vulgaris]XP_050848069.1 open rectifier potassium channel protein 1 isoform X1 [Vespula vulgaris]